MAHRLQAMGQPRYENGFALTLQEDVVELPLRWRKPRVIFVNSMSDLFHADVPISYIRRCFETMASASQHTFQVLTKRPERVAELARALPWPRNIWLGTSVENADYVWRISELTKVPALIRFLSVEPLLGPIPQLPLRNIDWVIVGGESGPGARQMKKPWVMAIRDRCIRYQVPFFFKQWGGVHKSRTGRMLDGRTWDEMPKTEGGRYGTNERPLARAV
jgi:protein gp37